MIPTPDDDQRLESLLRAIPAPEPPPGFSAAARRRYAQAREARYRHEALAALGAAVLALGVAAVTLLTLVEPLGLVAWLAVVTADLTAWGTGGAIVLSLVPPLVWLSTVAGAVAALLPLALLARAREPAVVK